MTLLFLAEDYQTMAAFLARLVDGQAEAADEGEEIAAAIAHDSALEIIEAD